MNLYSCRNVLVLDVTGNGRDFNSSLTNATFLPGEITSFINIPLTDDIIAEPSENFRVSLVMEQPFAALGVIHGDPSSATVFITDDDGIVFCICVICMYILVLYFGRYLSKFDSIH